MTLNQLHPKSALQKNFHITHHHCILFHIKHPSLYVFSFLLSPPSLVTLTRSALYSRDMDCAIESSAPISCASWQTAHGAQHHTIRTSLQNVPAMPFCSRTFWRMLARQMMFAMGQNVTRAQRMHDSPTFSAILPAT